MKVLILMWAVSACVYGYVPGSSVKGGPSRYTNEQDRYNYNPYSQTQSARPIEVEETGVCYIEVPTANLGNNENNVRGNGSRPDLSRIRTCCRGYTTNRYDPSVCDPVCSKGCINAYCVAPEKCQCYPDYEQDSDGSCTQTTQKCPHSCQNGHCARDECICDFGYKWDAESKRCKPKCKDDCAGIGTCTAPNYCSCRPGYQSTAEGSCESESQGNSKPLCHSSCPHNSVCIGPNVCSSPTTSVEYQEHHIQPNNVRPQYSENQVDSSYSQHQQNPNHDHHDNQNYPHNQNYQHSANRQNLYNPYGEQSQDFYNQRSNDQSQQGTYRRPQESYDTRNQGDRNHDTTQHQSSDNYNQRSYDSQRGQYVDRNAQSTSTTNQYHTEYERNRDDSTQHHYDDHHQRAYDSSQYSYDQRQHHASHNTQSTSTSNQYNTEYERNQNLNQERNISSQDTNGSSQQRPYDSSRREDVSANQGNYHSHQGSYGTEQESYITNQRPYFYYPSNSINHIKTTEAYNQMHSQYGGSHYPDQSIDQQRNVPECSMYCINGHCVEGNRCSCNPGYIPDKTNPNVCQPECPEGCVNGVCSAPRLCLCNAGYYKDKSVKGQVCVKRIR